jgi:hypothetical protein
MSRSAEVMLAFAGEDRLFRLPIGRLRAIQEKCDAGPMELMARYISGKWRVDDLREPILQGLVGGGLTQGEATRLVQSNFDDLPLQEFVGFAQAIVAAAVVGAPDESLGEDEAGEVSQKTPSPAQSSVSPGSTAPEPSSV